MYIVCYRVKRVWRAVNEGYRPPPSTPLTYLPHCHLLFVYPYICIYLYTDIFWFVTLCIYRYHYILASPLLMFPLYGDLYIGDSYMVTSMLSDLYIKLSLIYTTCSLVRLVTPISFAIQFTRLGDTSCSGIRCFWIYSITRFMLSVSIVFFLFLI